MKSRNSNLQQGPTSNPVVERLKDGLGALESMISDSEPSVQLLLRSLSYGLMDVDRLFNDSTAKSAPNSVHVKESDTDQPAIMPGFAKINEKPTASTTKAAVGNNAVQRHVTFPAFTPQSSAPKLPNLKVATVLDAFSQAAFEYEWTNIALHPKTWLQQMEIEKPDFLFIESAWSGNNGDWIYRFTGQRAPWPEVIAMLEWCKIQGVPTIFWNKEDPPHYNDFIKTAKLFDVIFTSDINCVKKYKEELGHDRVYVLPFAAQPRMHNPARPHDVKRTRNIAFGGMYFRHKYPERRMQMDYLLPAAQKFDVDIFSRQLGSDENYQFPEAYAKNIVGSLDYSQMVTAYHAYKVFLNVNSVIDSESMCARRIFEITACGASVLTPYTPAIRNFFPGDMLPIVTNEAEAYNVMRGLLRSEGYRTRQVHKAQRNIWLNHTYAHRVDEILSSVGLPRPNRKKTITVMAPTIRPHRVDSILETVARQVGVDVQLVLNAHGFKINEKEIRSKAKRLGITDFKLMQLPKSKSLGECLNAMVRVADGDILTKMDDDDYYGDNYLLDMMLALDYSGAQVVGKAATYIHFESKDATVLTYAAHEHRYTDFVRGSTLTGSRETFQENPFMNVGISEDSNFLKSVMRDGGKIYGADRFNYVVMRNADVSAHTWQEEDEKLFASGDAESYGNPIAHVTV